MTEFFRSLRREPRGHRDVFAEFAVQLVFMFAAGLAARGAGRRMVR